MKLTAQQRKTRDEAVSKFTAARDLVVSAVNEYNDLLEQITKLTEKIDGAVQAYNEDGEALETVLQDIGGDLHDDWSEKSERWQESEAGSLASEWIDAYATFKFDELDLVYLPESDALDEPEELELPTDESEAP